MYANKLGDQDDLYTESYNLQETYREGDIVATPQGRGEIAKVKREGFDMPSRHGTKHINARLNKPVYIVKFGDRYGLYKAHNLEKSSYEEDGTANQGSGRAIATASKHDMQESDLDLA